MFPQQFYKLINTKMLSSMLKEHKIKREETNKQNEKKKFAAVSAVNNFNIQFMKDIDKE